MLCIKSISHDPWFNLAAEEFLLKNTDQEYFITCINEPSVIVGKHQNAYAEINLGFVRNNNIRVARRLTGGGTVYHDYGNLNYSFIVNGKEGQLVDFKKHTLPILAFLEKLSVRAEFAGKNDLLMDGLKISGNAEHVFRERVLHHGTLLVSADLSSLSGALNTGPSKYSDKAVRSVRSRVSNIMDSLDQELTVDQLREQLSDYIRKEKGGADYDLTEKQQMEITSLRDQKFSTWEWNFGYSPQYTFTNKIIREGRMAEIILEVNRGIIKNASVRGDLMNEVCAGKISHALHNSAHHFDGILDLFRQFTDMGCFQDIDPEDFTMELF